MSKVRRLRHDTIRDGLVPAMRPIFTAVKLEQFIHELAQFDKNTGERTEARMDIVAETGNFRAMLDIRCFVSTLKCGWRSTRAHEMEKHRRYVIHQHGRRCTKVERYAAVGCIRLRRCRIPQLQRSRRWRHARRTRKESQKATVSSRSQRKR